MEKAVWHDISVQLHLCVRRKVHGYCAQTWWTSSLNCPYISRHVYTHSKYHFMFHFDTWTKVRLNMHVPSLHTKIAFFFLFILVNLKTISTCKGETDKMPKEISLVSLLSVGHLGFRAKTRLATRTHQMEIVMHSFCLSWTQHSTHTHSGDKQTTQLQVQCYEAIAVTHSAVHRKFEIVTIKAIKAMHWIRFSEKL